MVQVVLELPGELNPTALCSAPPIAQKSWG